MARNELSRMIRDQRIMRELTLQQLAATSGVSASHLGRIERGERFPSAHILRKIAKPLGFGETDLFTLADYLSPQADKSEAQLGRLDPYVSGVLSQEPVEVQRALIGILAVLRSMAQAKTELPEFRDYARSKYPDLDEDMITMIEDILEPPPKG